MDEDAFHLRGHMRRHLMRHMAMVPKGFLRYQILKMLDEKPMSGSEIMSETEKQTNGYWKPSPGSIYPLLAWLQDKGHIRETTEHEPGIRRYALTEQGNEFLEEQTKTREELGKRVRHLEPFGFGFVGPMGFGFLPERAGELHKATRDLSVAVWRLRRKLRCQYSEKTAEEARKTLEETTKKIEEITKGLIK
jgi:DNA-binding PadR family transcriptional regulator